MAYDNKIQTIIIVFQSNNWLIFKSEFYNIIFWKINRTAMFYLPVEWTPFSKVYLFGVQHTV